MKKFLLSMAVAALATNMMNATDYVLFSKDNYSSINWEVAEDGFKADVTANGKTFTIQTSKSKSSTTLIKPTDQIRVYKSSDIIITSNDVVMKQVILTASASSYAGAQAVSEPWTTSAEGLVTTLKNEAGAKTVTFSAKDSQFRIVNLVVSDAIGGSTPTPPATYTKVNSITQVKALKSGDKVEVDFPMTVAFVNNSNIFVTDAAGDFIQIYGSNKCESNSIIPAGWKAEYDFYQSTTPELKPETLPTSTEKGTFVPAIVPADKISVDMVNSVVTIQNVVFDKDIPSAKENFTGTVGSTSLSFRNNYQFEGVAAGTYDVTVVVTVYQNAPSLYVIKFTAPGASVGEIAVDENAEAVYYNLQGVKVAEPNNGVFIKVQGKKATKVFVGK